MGLEQLRELVEQDEQRLIEDTFGPNTCKAFALMSNKGDYIQVACGKKRCVNCGPRKQYFLAMILEALGRYSYIGRVEPETVDDNGAQYAELNRAMETMKKRAQRNGLDHGT